jgi:uncharacterized protein YbbC (DUF1343 family)
LHVTDRASFKPVLATAAMFHEFHAAAPDRFAWRQPPYEYEHEKMPIDILSGSSALRQQIESGMGPRDIAASWEPETTEFLKLRDQFLLHR